MCSNTYVSDKMSHIHYVHLTLDLRPFIMRSIFSKNRINLNFSNLMLLSFKAHRNRSEEIAGFLKVQQD
jgi:hypothetical protein